MMMDTSLNMLLTHFLAFGDQGHDAGEIFSIVYINYHVSLLRSTRSLAPKFSRPLRIILPDGGF